MSGKKTEKIAEGAAPLIIAVIALIAQIRGNYSNWWTALIILLCALGCGTLFLRWRRYRSASARKRTLWACAGWLFLAGGALTLTLAPQTQSSTGPETTGGTSAASPSASPTSAASIGDDSLKTLLTVPDETGSCASAGALSKGPSFKPGAFAITPGTQVSVLLQGSLPAKMVVTHIRTVVDGRPPKFTGNFENLTNPCQGTQDEEFYIANLNGNGGDISLNPEAKKSDQLPITVSSDDPVSVYIDTPTSIPGAEALSWHIEITWDFQGIQHVTKVYNSGFPIIVSTR